MKKRLGTYYLGATIAEPDVVARVKLYSYMLHRQFGVDVGDTLEEDIHITIVPPFYADYVTASGINFECALMTLSSDHPITQTEFSIQGLDIMHFGVLDVIYFPVRIHPRAKIRRGFIEHVKEVRQRMASSGIKFKEPLLQGYTPHITALVMKDAAKQEGIVRIINESKIEPFLFFRTGYPTLYAKYPRIGYQPLSQDPSLEQ